GDDTDGAPLGQRQKPFIGLLVRGVVIAIRGCVSDFTMIGHWSLQHHFKKVAGISPIAAQGQRPAAFSGLIKPPAGKLCNAICEVFPRCGTGAAMAAPKEASPSPRAPKSGSR